MRNPHQDWPSTWVKQYHTHGCPWGSHAPQGERSGRSGKIQQKPTVLGSKCRWSKKINECFLWWSCILWNVMQTDDWEWGGEEGKQGVWSTHRPVTQTRAGPSSALPALLPLAPAGTPCLVVSHHSLNLLGCRSTALSPVSLLALGDYGCFWVRWKWRGILSDAAPHWLCCTWSDAGNGLHTWWQRETSNDTVKGQVWVEPEAWFHLIPSFKTSLGRETHLNTKFTYFPNQKAMVTTTATFVSLKSIHIWEICQEKKQIMQTSLNYLTFCWR